MLPSDIKKRQSKSQRHTALSLPLRDGGGTAGLRGGRLHHLQTSSFSCTRAHTHQGRKVFGIFVLVLKAFLFKKKKKKQIKIFPTGGYFFFCLLKIFITQISPIPTCQRKDVLALCKTNHGERLENKSPPSFPPFPGPE